jgi:conjugative transfer signal peptidase TraF
MNPGRYDKLAHLMRTALLGIGLCIGVFQICGWIGLRINVSPSLPVGLYITTDSSKLIEFCPAEPFASVAILRGYRDRGACPDGGAPLLKPIVALAGDELDLSAPGIAVNHRPIPNTLPLAVDTKGRPLKHWPFGHYNVSREVVWVASSYNARSFDSRYFGPVPVASIRSRVRPILTF